MDGFLQSMKVVHIRKYSLIHLWKNNSMTVIQHVPVVVISKAVHPMLTLVKNRS